MKKEGVRHFRHIRHMLLFIPYSAREMSLKRQNVSDASEVSEALISLMALTSAEISWPSPQPKSFGRWGPPLDLSSASSFSRMKRTPLLSSGALHFCKPRFSKAVVRAF